MSPCVWNGHRLPRRNDQVHPRKQQVFQRIRENYTNASFIVDEKFDFNDGLFSGYDPATRKYDKATWVHKTR